MNCCLCRRLLWLQKKERDDYKQVNSNLLSKITALEERLKVRNKHLYGAKSQKGIRNKKRATEEGHTRDKDDFDGTPQSLASSSPQPGEAPAPEEDVVARPVPCGNLCIFSPFMLRILVM